MLALALIFPLVLIAALQHDMLAYGIQIGYRHFS
jgi:hypothetical protein